MADIGTITVHKEQENPIKIGEPFVKNNIYLRKEDIINSVKQQQQQRVKKFADKLNKEFRKLLISLKNDVDTRFVVMDKPKVWFDRNVAAVYPMKPMYHWYYTYRESYKEAKVINPFVVVEDDSLVFEIPTLEEVQKSFRSDLGNPMCKKGESLVCYFNGQSYYEILCTKGGERGFYVNRSIEADFRKSGSYYNLTCIPIFRINGVNSKPFSFNESVISWFKYGMIPEGLSKATRNFYIKILDDFKAIEKYLVIEEDNVFIEESKVIEDILNGSLKDLLGESFDFEREINDVKEGKCGIQDLSAIETFLLECDYKRANLSKYDNKRIYDLQLGHWELCETPDDRDSEKYFRCKTDKVLVARPPRKDVREDITCGIDFGTKSTVVAVYDTESRLLRIGSSNTFNEPGRKDYENPTAIELVDIVSFMQAYSERIGRPFTEWSQITVSHTAAGAIYEKDVDSSIYYSVISELKQWANSNRPLQVKDGNHNTIDIQPFLDIGESDFNPIEIYAYYLGLYINNMNSKGICLHYVLSFPVNFSYSIRKQLLKCFERGLRKSLPAVLLNDDEIMEQFEVYEGASEPAAYAITAIEEYGLQPKNDGEKVYYGVFDFGGGTTDFDFGYEVKVNTNGKKRAKYKYELHRFGEGGDQYLGGENILLLLGYEVYKQNFAKLREYTVAFNGQNVNVPIPIVIPHKGKFFAGSEKLVYETDRGSQAAALNSRILGQALRPIWENTLDSGNCEHSELSDGKLVIELYSDAKIMDKDLYKVELDVNVEQLQEYIKSLIDEGVQNFFAACREAYEYYDGLESDVHILLAGNSSKSPIVRELFAKYIKLESCYLNGSNVGSFILHAPLGTLWEDVNDHEATLMNCEVDYSKQRTGKTGVVFGLLRSRRGGRDVKVINDNGETEARFPYYLGIADDRECFEIVLGMDVPYNTWVAFDYAFERSFELYYTSMSKAIEGELPVSSSDVYLTRCLIDEEDVIDDDETMIFIRKIDPNTIEYAVGIENDFNDFKESDFPRKIYRKAIRA